MFGPVLWLAMSSFKTPRRPGRVPADACSRSRQIEVAVDGYDDPLPLYEVTMEDGTTKRTLAQVRRIGIVAQMVDPERRRRRAYRRCRSTTRARPYGNSAWHWENYTGSRCESRSTSCGYLLQLHLIVTVVATLITLLINSMAAYGLAIYEFKRAQRSMHGCS